MVEYEPYTKLILPLCELQNSKLRNRKALACAGVCVTAIRLCVYPLQCTPPLLLFLCVHQTRHHDQLFTSALPLFAPRTTDYHSCCCYVSTAVYTVNCCCAMLCHYVSCEQEKPSKGLHFRLVISVMAMTYLITVLLIQYVVSQISYSKAVPQHRNWFRYE